MERSLEGLGIAPDVATTLVAAARGARGMIILCGPTGTGKTTLAEALAAETHVAFLGDLRLPDELERGLRRAARDRGLAVTRGGESLSLLRRWHDMGIAESLVDSAAVPIVTLRRLPREGAPCPAPFVLVVEVIDANGRPSLAHDGAFPQHRRSPRGNPHVRARRASRTSHSTGAS